MNKRNPHVLCIDGYNFMHRARSGFIQGNYAVVYNFFRNLRALVEQQKPTKIYFVIEGYPRARFEMMESYKANRVIDPQAQPEKHESLVQFHRQKCIIIGLLKAYFPITVIRHPHHECDDAIFNLINNASKDDCWTVVSNDSDFIQLLPEFDNVKLYNPMKKEYVKSPPYDYLTWKSLRGDSSDNIPGVPGIGDKRAAAFASDIEALSTALTKSPTMAEIFIRNLELIRFIVWDDLELSQVQSWMPDKPMWQGLSIAFKTMGFQSLLKDKTWIKFVETFDSLWK